MQRKTNKKATTKQANAKKTATAKKPAVPKQRAVKAAEAATQARQENKKTTVLNLLQRETGATLDELMTATGWQAHSVRGFISGTAKKRLGLTITRDGSTYRVTTGA